MSDFIPALLAQTKSFTLTTYQTRFVFCVQNEDGNGPFRSGNPDNQKLEKKLSKRCADLDLPVPLREENLEAYWDEGTHHCGVATISEIEVWFGGFIEELYAHGFSIWMLELPLQAVHDGERQVIFDPTYKISSIGMTVDDYEKRLAEETKMQSSSCKTHPTKLTNSSIRARI